MSKKPKSQTQKNKYSIQQLSKRLWHIEKVLELFLKSEKHASNANRAMEEAVRKLRW